MSTEQVFLCTLSGEISLKSPRVRRMFEKRLKDNLGVAAASLEIQGMALKGGHGTLVINAQDGDKLRKLLEHTFGVQYFADAMHAKAESMHEILDSVGPFVIENLPPSAKSFAVRANRHGTHAFSSGEIMRKAGKKIQEMFPKLKVNLRNPDFTVNIELRDKDLFVHSGWKNGAGGLPWGIEGTAALFAENIDDAILSGFLLLRRGARFAVYFTEKNPEYEKKFGDALEKWNCFRKFDFHAMDSFKELCEKY